MNTGVARTDGPTKGTRPRRVSSDLLADLLGAQRGTQAEPYLHVNPENPDHVLVGWQENRYLEGSAQALVAGVSFDGGRRFEQVVIPGLTFDAGGRRGSERATDARDAGMRAAGPWDLASDPWPEIGPDGRAYFASLVGDADPPYRTGITVSVSDDGGRTWGAPITVTESTQPDFNDKPAMTVDTVAGSRHRGNVYVVWDVNVLNGAGTAFERQDIYAARSTDAGASFEAPKLVRTGAIGGGVIARVGRKGRVFLLFTGEGVANRYALFVTSSTNGGRTWKRPKRLWDIVGESVTDVRDGFSLASFAVDPAGGNLYAVWQDSRSGVPRVLLSLSTDNGRAWSAPIDVVDAPAEVPAFTPAVAVNGRGDVGISYYSLQRDPTLATRADVYARISTDGGRTFAEAQRMTRKTFDLRQAARSSRGWFLGDYMGLSGGADDFHLAWISTRAGAQPDVWVARTR